jgi:Flp pilus assembly secretin CpaC
VVTGDSDVSLQLEIQFRALGAQSFNGVPVISNREYKGNITLADGEPAVVAGTLSRSEQLSMTGLPGLGYVPGLNHVMTSNTKAVDDDELLIVITPHMTSPPTGQTTEVWLAK